MREERGNQIDRERKEDQRKTGRQEFRVCSLLLKPAEIALRSNSIEKEARSDRYDEMQ